MTEIAARAARFFTFVRRFKSLEILLAMILLALAGAYVYTALRLDAFSTFAPLVDDAYIPVRYAHNAAQGFGFVWNRGEARVDGFTSLLWVCMLLIMEKAGITPLAHLSQLGALFAVISMGLMLALLERLNPGRRSENLAAVILLGLSQVLWRWSMAGLETTLFAALLLASSLAYLAQRAGQMPAWVAGAIFGLLALTRPEGALLFGLTAALDAALAWRAGSGQFKRTLVLAAGFAVIYVPAFLWEWAYFGDPVPNTYYDKAGAGWIQINGGWSYLTGSLLMLAVTSSLPLLLALVPYRKLSFEGFYILYLVLCACALIVLEGGDHFPEARFLVPVLPLLLVLAAFGISEVTARISPANRALFLGALIGIGVLLFDPVVTLAVKPAGARLPTADDRILQYLPDGEAGFTVMGKTLRRMASPDQSIAVVPIGAIGYYSGLKVFDMLGLTDPVIAHEPFDLSYIATWRPGHDKGDGLYILSKRPDFIMLLNLLTSRPQEGLNVESMQYKSIVEIWNAPEFHSLYEFLPIRVEGRWYYNLYRLRAGAP